MKERKKARKKGNKKKGRRKKKEKLRIKEKKRRDDRFRTKKKFIPFHITESNHLIKQIVFLNDLSYIFFYPVSRVYLSASASGT